VPPQKRRRRDDRGHLGQKLAPEAFGSHGQPTPLVIREPQPSFTQLFAQNTVLLSLVFDHLKLALIHPSGNCDQYKPKWIEDNRHRVYCYIIQGPDDWSPQRIFDKIQFPGQTRSWKEKINPRAATHRRNTPS
jgi:hypothetical protein